MNKRKLGSFALCTTLFALCVNAEAQQQTKVAKVGWLSVRGSMNTGQEIIVRMLHDLGYVEGKNITYEYRFADNKLEQIPILADELVRLNVDVLLTPGTLGALALKKATQTIPIVFADVTDPVAVGLVSSLARPGGNITGFTSVETALAGKRLELLKEAISKLNRVAVLWDPQNPSSTQEWKESHIAARNPWSTASFHGGAQRADQYESAFKEAAKARSAALAACSSQLASSNEKRITDLATKHRLPAIYVQGSFVVTGGLMSYGPDRNERYKRVAVFVDKILKGAKPADLPVEQPTKF